MATSGDIFGCHIQKGGLLASSRQRPGTLLNILQGTGQPPNENLCVCALSRVRLFATLWTAAHQALLSMGFSRQEYWSGWPCPPPGNLPNPGIELMSPALSGGFFTTSAPGKPKQNLCSLDCQSCRLRNPDKTYMSIMLTF